MNWTSSPIRHLIRQALQEDAARQDVTTQTLIPSDLKIEAVIRAKQTGVVCGLPLAEASFKALDSRLSFQKHIKEGQEVRSGQVLAVIRGKARAILSGERTALNAVQHLSGVATYTREQVRRLPPGRTGIYDTRKTIPGWRELQKYAVKCGGGKNHRMSLKDGVLIKDNHLQICRLIGKDWMSAIRTLRKKRPSLPVELEVQTERDMKDALRLKPHQVLLDNMRPAAMRKLGKRLRQAIRGVELEVSGGVKAEQLRVLGRLGVERISMGRLTHSAPAFDCALDITRVLNPR
jgi:nicotinate-nucleotide pyrophosphorylase (carboxylating)